MSMTLDDLGTALDAIGLSFRPNPAANRIVLSLKAERYRTPDDQTGILLVIDLSDENRYLKLIAPGLWRLTDPGAKTALLEALCWLNLVAKVWSFGFDPASQDVIGLVKIPLEDDALGQSQLTRCITGLWQLVEDTHPLLTTTLETGRFTPPTGAPTDAPAG